MNQSVRGRAASVAVATTVGLTALKLSAAALSGSVSVLSEGVHSLLDLVSALITYFTVQEAVKPADRHHPFGHGKIETISSLFESMLLVLAAALIVYEGIDHLLRPHPISHQKFAFAAIFISMVASFGAYRHNRAAALQADSSALGVNSLHFLSDAVASAGVLAGLALLRLTGWMPIDSIIAFGVAGYTLVITIRQIVGALRELSDTQLPESEVAAIERIIANCSGKRNESQGRARGEAIGAHDLRTRKSGATRHIDFHLLVCQEMTVQDSHSICDEIEERISAVFPGSSVNIHVEPCAQEDPNCHQECDRKKASQN